MGFLSGFPWVIIGTWIAITLKDRDVSLTTIGIAGIPALFYSFNLLWGPICDRYKLYPIGMVKNQSNPNEKHAMRTVWIAVTCLGVLLATLLGAYALPTAGEGLTSYWLLGVCVLVVALCGSVADVNIDAKRIEFFERHESEKQGLGSTCATIGWWLGYGIPGAILLFGIGELANQTPEHAHSLAVLIPVLMYALCLGLVLFLLERQSNHTDTQIPDDQEAKNGSGINIRIALDYAKPVVDFFKHHGLSTAATIFAIIFMFKIGEAFLGRMSILFYQDIGFTHQQIAIGSKLTGTITVCIAAFFGGILSLRFGILRSMLIGGILMASTNLLFAALAVVGPNMPLFISAVVLDQVTSGVSTVAFVAFISCLCQREHTATQYAAFSSLANATRTSVALASGFVVEGLLENNWAVFFILTSVLVLPSLLLIVFSKRRLNLIIEQRVQ